MEQLLLVNPRRRKRRTPPRGPGGRFLSRKRSAPRKRRGRRRNPVPTSLALSNPRRRRRSVARTVRRGRQRNPAARGFIGNLTRPLMPAVVGAGGAVLTDAAYGMLPLPAALKAGYASIATKAVLAVGLGMLIGQFVNRRIGEQMTAGALTVQAHQALAPMLSGLLPGGVGYYGAGYALPAGVGEYISEIPNSMADSNFYARDPLSEYISD